jgi:SAM-dependent methyltransferase
MASNAADAYCRNGKRNRQMMKSAKNYLRSRFPRAWAFLRTTNHARKLLPRIYGYERRDCNLCGHRGHFYAEIHFPDIFVYDAICPKCSAASRNRLLKLAIDELGLLHDSTKLLHFAPERPVARVVSKMVGEYATADLFADGVDLKLDIESIDQPDERWDAIICCHVLEHVDHLKALPELRRILTPGGAFLAMFPVVEGWDGHYENPNIKSNRDRGLHFGREDHRRRFGGSIRGEFVAAGFELETFAPIGPEVVQFGLIPGETLFIGRRPATF